MSDIARVDVVQKAEGNIEAPKRRIAVCVSAVSRVAAMPAWKCPARAPRTTTACTVCGESAPRSKHGSAREVRVGISAFGDYSLVSTYGEWSPHRRHRFGAAGDRQVLAELIDGWAHLHKLLTAAYTSACPSRY
jgi:hypothetical protein